MWTAQTVEPLEAIPERIDAARKHTVAEPGLSSALRVRSSVSAWRYEIKYAVPRTARAALLADLLPLTEADGHGDQAGGYFVHSIYLDSPEWTCFLAKMDGVAIRFKLRVRAYSLGADNAPGAFKLEIKERDADRVRKVTATVDDEAFRILWPAIRSFHMPDPAILARSSALARFFRLKSLEAMLPVVDIRYRRIALVSRLDRRCRLTLDDQLESQFLPDGFQSGNGSRGVALEKGSILEVKSLGTAPSWLSGIVRRHGLQRRAISKYALAIVRCGLATD